MNEKDIRQFIHGDKYLKQLLKTQLEEEINNLNLWLPEYERYHDTNPRDKCISTLLQKGKERLRILELLLIQDLEGEWL